MKKFCLYILLWGCLFLFTACSIQKDDTRKLRDIEYTVMDHLDVPEEFLNQIEKKKESVFCLTYGDNGYLYVARGYGKRSTSGYSVKVTSCYETSNTIVVKTGLLGPPKEEEIIKKDTCPYVVIKMEYNDKNVVFN